TQLTTLDYNAIEKQDAIILNELKEIPQSLITTLKSFYAKGGNVVIIPSAESSLQNLNSLLTGFGNASFRPFAESEKKITKIAFSHPLYQTVFEKKTDNFQYPSTKSGFTLSGNAVPVLSYEDQTPFLGSITNRLG